MNKKNVFFVVGIKYNQLCFIHSFNKIVYVFVKHILYSSVLKINMMEMSSLEVKKLNVIPVKESAINGPQTFCVRIRVGER